MHSDVVAVKRKKRAKKAVRAKAPAKAPPGRRQLPLYYPKPDEMRGKVRMEPPKIPQPSEPIDISPQPLMKAVAKRKELPYAATAMGGAALLSGAIAMFFYYVIRLDAVYALVLALTFFIGLSILFYEFLELAERTSQ